MAGKLSPTRTLREFENSYWYVDDFRQFAIQIGLSDGKRLRKDELECAIVTFLRTGKVKVPTQRALRKLGMKDIERGLCLSLRIEHYTSNRETKDFIVREARELAPGIAEKSGVWCRLISLARRANHQGRPSYVW